jgi:hypothetical protein
LDPRTVDSTPHEPVKRIDFLYQMPFSKAAYGGIAGHFSDGVQPLGNKNRACTHTRRRRRRLTAGVAATYYDHIKIGSRADHDKISGLSRGFLLLLSIFSKRRPLLKK